MRAFVVNKLALLMLPLLCEQALKMKTLLTIDAIEIPEKNSCLHSLVRIIYLKLLMLWIVSWYLWA
jgi:hypothetical protein